MFDKTHGSLKFEQHASMQTTQISQYMQQPPPSNTMSFERLKTLQNFQSSRRMAGQ